MSPRTYSFAAALPACLALGFSLTGAPASLIICFTYIEHGQQGEFHKASPGSCIEGGIFCILQTTPSNFLSPLSPRLVSASPGNLFAFFLVPFFFSFGQVALQGRNNTGTELGVHYSRKLSTVCLLRLSHAFYIRLVA